LKYNTKKNEDCKHLPSISSLVLLWTFVSLEEVFPTPLKSNKGAGGVKSNTKKSNKEEDI
jgi:hypothetical protein